MVTTSARHGAVHRKRHAANTAAMGGPVALFRALPGDMALRDALDLMAYPFFSLAKSRRSAPIHFEAGGVTLTVEGVPQHGIATIWDADVLILRLHA